MLRTFFAGAMVSPAGGVGAVSTANAAPAALMGPIGGLATAPVPVVECPKGPFQLSGAGQRLSRRGSGDTSRRAGGSVSTAGASGARACDCR